MYLQDLVSLFDPAELALIEAIPVTHRRFIDVAIAPLRAFSATSFVQPA